MSARHRILVAVAASLLPGLAAAQAHSTVPTDSRYSTSPSGGSTSTAPGTDAPWNGSGPSGGSTYDTSGSTQYNTSSSGTTEQRLRDSEKADSGRGLELVWLRAEGAFSYVNTAAFAGGDRIGLTKSESVGPMVGVGAGLRLFVLTLGVRGRLHTLSAFNLWQANLVAAVHIPISSLDLWVDLHGGYSAANAFSSDSVLMPQGLSNPYADVSLKGGNVGLGVGFDYYLNRFVSVGLGVTGETLLLSRGKLSLPDNLSSGDRSALENLALYQDSAGLAGIGIAGGLRVGLHFGL